MSINVNDKKKLNTIQLNLIYSLIEQMWNKTKQQNKCV